MYYRKLVVHTFQWGGGNRVQGCTNPPTCIRDTHLCTSWARCCIRRIKVWCSLSYLTKPVKAAESTRYNWVHRPTHNASRFPTLLIEKIGWTTHFLWTVFYDCYIRNLPTVADDGWVRPAFSTNRPQLAPMFWLTVNSLQTSGEVWLLGRVSEVWL